METGLFYIKTGYSRINDITYKDKKEAIIGKNHSFSIDSQALSIDN
jgi:hypothetical protein